ncbi:hypothetical protein CC2G_013954 [Coprinopsis cinerea AmutBmut pab1-1]|nr:hypothetical protein CC2G_013954 [Coprinopsis cinerea AmutBmut pab1-1]
MTSYFGHFTFSLSYSKLTFELIKIFWVSKDAFKFKSYDCPRPPAEWAEPSRRRFALLRKRFPDEIG